MDAATRELVRQRAGNRCEYCLHPELIAQRLYPYGGTTRAIPEKDMHRGLLLCFRLRVLCVLCGESLGFAIGPSGPVPTTPLFFFSVFVSACSAFSAVKSLGFRCLPLNV